MMSRVDYRLAERNIRTERRTPMTPHEFRSNGYFMNSRAWKVAHDRRTECWLSLPV